MLGVKNKGNIKYFIGKIDIYKNSVFGLGDIPTKTF